jgi:16S rRNA C1402 (ribose-2'-O) methylase RsmI
MGFIHKNDEHRLTAGLVQIHTYSKVRLILIIKDLTVTVERVVRKNFSERNKKFPT